MDSLRRRCYAYILGASEFADNIRLNIVDRLRPYETSLDISRNAKDLQGKVDRCTLRLRVVRRTLKLTPHGG